MIPKDIEKMKIFYMIGILGFILLGVNDVYNITKLYSLKSINTIYDIYGNKINYYVYFLGYMLSGIFILFFNIRIIKLNNLKDSLYIGGFLYIVLSVISIRKIINLCNIITFKLMGVLENIHVYSYNEYIYLIEEISIILYIIFYLIMVKMYIFIVLFFVLAKLNHIYKKYFSEVNTLKVSYIFFILATILVSVVIFIFGANDVLEILSILSRSNIALPIIVTYKFLMFLEMLTIIPFFLKGIGELIFSLSLVYIMRSRDLVARKIIITKNKRKLVKKSIS